jgi:hypothetical protein
MIIDILGWVGAALILIAYYLVSSKKVKGDSNVFQAMNLFGAIALMINTYAKGAIPSVFLNIFWAGIAAKALLSSHSVR